MLPFGRSFPHTKNFRQFSKCFQTCGTKVHQKICFPNLDGEYSCALDIIFIYIICIYVSYPNSCSLMLVILAIKMGLKIGYPEKWLIRISIGNCNEVSLNFIFWGIIWYMVYIYSIVYIENNVYI